MLGTQAAVFAVADKAVVDGAPFAGFHLVTLWQASACSSIRARVSSWISQPGHGADSFCCNFTACCPCRITRCWEQAVNAIVKSNIITSGNSLAAFLSGIVCGLLAAFWSVGNPLL
jgi:hypothetical protein